MKERPKTFKRQFEGTQSPYLYVMESPVQLEKCLWCRYTPSLPAILQLKREVPRTILANINTSSIYSRKDHLADSRLCPPPLQYFKILESRRCVCEVKHKSRTSPLINRFRSIYPPAQTTTYFICIAELPSSNFSKILGNATTTIQKYFLLLTYICTYYDDVNSQKTICCCCCCCCCC